MGERNLGALPFLDEMRRLDLARQYERWLIDQHPTASAGEARDAADTASRLMAPIEQAIQLGEIDGFNGEITVQGLTLAINNTRGDE